MEHPLFSYLPLQSANDTRWDIWKFSTQHPHSATGVWGLSDYGIFVLKFALYLFLRNKSLKLSKKILQISPFSPKSQAHPAIPLFHFLNLKIPESAESGKITQKWQPWPSTIQSFLKNMLFSQFKKFRLWDIWTLNIVRDIITDSTLPIVSLTYSSTSQHLLAARNDGSLLAWDSPHNHKKSPRFPPFINLTLQ